jgi:SAM-dependent methyltransferase
MTNAEFGCRVCGVREVRARYVARETMYGWGDEFEYLECEGCGCVQIGEIPVDLERFYGNQYYSYSLSPRVSWVSRELKVARTEYWLGNGGLAGWIAAKAFAPPRHLSWMRNAGAKRSSRILDVGCGGGALLSQMQENGFENLTGVDPYVDQRTVDESRLRILRTTLENVQEKFDVVMLNHSFEHMPDPVESIRDVHRMVVDGGCAIVRIPVASSYARRKYGVNWIQWDAPRHICLHTMASMSVLANLSGFAIERVEHDSDAFQFWGSEQCVRGLPLTDPHSYAKDPSKSQFSAQQIDEYKQKANALNQQGDGDQAVFYLRKL